MKPDQATDYVAGMMQQCDISFGTAPDGRHRAQFGSAAVVVTFSPWGDDDTVVGVSSAVLEQLGEVDDLQILAELNRLNAEAYFGRWVRYPEAIAVEREMLVSQLQRDEFMHALYAIAQLSDENDERLQQLFGGKTWLQAEQETNDATALDV